MSSGKLYICATPIGNLEDITYRTLKILRAVDMIAAEDTRHTLRLLNHFEIKSKLVSYHEHNKIEAGHKILKYLQEGLDVALVSDAGMPAISDPGEDLVKLCLDHDIRIEALPGPSAFVTALAASGLATRNFYFEGFLDRNKKQRRNRLESLKKMQATLIFYESPHRLLETLNDMLKIFGDRQVVLARELTKKYEEYHRNTLSSALAYFKDKGVKGEFVVLLEGSDELEEVTFDMTIKDHIIQYMDQGHSKKEAITLVAKERKIAKKEVYNESLDLKK